MRRILTLGLLISATLPAAGCATREWVHDLVGKRDAQVDQRVTAETRRLDGRLGTVEASAGDAAETARQARGRAEAAYGRADEVNGRLSRLWAGRHQRNVVETIHVQFGFDRAELSDGAQTALLAIVKELKENAQLSVDLEGFTDSTGARDYNVGLSQRRVEAVRRFLIQNGTELSRIYWVGLGPLAATDRPDEQSRQRRVTLKVLIND